MAEAFVLETLRTARTKASPRGGFASVSPVDLLVSLQRELTVRTSLDPGRIEDVIIGCASQNAEQGANIARTATMLAGWGDVPGVTLNRFCASGIDAVAHAAARIRSHDLDLVAAGGVESVSRVPMFSDGGPLFCDPATVTAVGSVFMGISADLVATMEDYQRDELDAYGLETQRKAARAWDEGFFRRSLVRTPAPPASWWTATSTCGPRRPWRRWPRSSRPSPRRAPRGRTRWRWPSTRRSARSGT